MHHLLLVIIATGFLLLLVSRRYSLSTTYFLCSSLPLACFAVASLDQYLRGIQQLNHRPLRVAYDTSYLLTLVGLLMLLLNLKHKRMALRLTLATVLSSAPLVELFISTPRPMPTTKDFDSIFSDLKKIFAPYESKLVVVSDTPTYYGLETQHVMKNKHRLFFGAVRKGKSYVSFHLMPVYAFSELRELISPELKKRMQGKSCFNFSVPNPGLYKELAVLTKKGFRKFTSKQFYSKF